MMRHSALLPFSREHQTMLLVVYFLKHGSSPDPQYYWPSEPWLQKSALLEYYDTELKFHLVAEANYVLGAIAPHHSDELKEYGRLLLESIQTMEFLIEALMDSPLNELGAVYHDLHLNLEAHVQLTEFKLFPKLQWELKGDQLRELGLKSQAYYGIKPPNPEPFDRPSSSPYDAF